MTSEELNRKYGETATIPKDCPWIFPPAWWDRGLKAWGELLTEQWEIVKNRPKSTAQRRREQMMEATGRQHAQDLTDLAIEVLAGKKR